MDSWFNRFIRAQAKEHGSASALAKRLGVRKSVISDWMAGGKAETMLSLEKHLAALGGDISRALPEWKPPVPASADLLEENAQLKARIIHLEKRLKKIAQVSGEDQDDDSTEKPFDARNKSTSRSNRNRRTG